MQLRKAIVSLGVAALACGLLGACNYKGEFHRSAHDYGSRLPNDPKMARVRAYSPVTTDPKMHDNRYFEYSSKLSYKVSNLPGVSDAIVILTDKNAYVGITTDRSATGTMSHGGKRVHEQDNTGTTEGVYNVDTGSNRWDMRKIVTPYNSYFSHKDISDLSTEFRQTIALNVRAQAPNVQGVHISANQEFMNQMLDFARASWAGKPLAPLTPEFNKLAKYTFSLGDQVPIPLTDK
ncbi:YhcN/YlaJ family sporulation lipoprotein [Cohnella nanjingensis]|uniref:YhcN/YlaJ family sporulation lipoprotein n=1 Tax=Cohnella nanjingensis TaxID=1387779 RepID=A0A7X0VHT0_9BACL|nr:YhcN/YlaJ family sporulation lipoprotein [Cohnella nanjingensis]MBB6674467.1 YhcN/YlaJ family sporulation lipoprotein [Cohnella nanjingensis]